jgi:hypothetical protein
MEVLQESIEQESQLLHSSNKLTLVFNVAGVKYSKYKGFDNIKSGDKLSLSPDKYNKFDPFAIKIIDPQNQFIGFVPREYTEGLSNLLALGSVYTTTIVWIMNKEISVKVSIEIGNNYTKQNGNTV